MYEVRHKAGREKSLLRRHPWVFSGAIGGVDGHPADGETVRVVDDRGEFLAWGAISWKSQIRVRIWSWEEGEIIDRALFLHRLQAAIETRQSLGIAQHANAYRLVHGESDGLPGMVVDRYADILVLQILSSGAEYWRDTLADLLAELFEPQCIYERSDLDVRGLEGLPERSGVLRGSLPSALVEIHEHGLKYLVDVARGHKTGHYLDQRFNRLRIRELVEGREVLDCFSYTGGFTLNALLGGAASVVAVDSSKEALDRLRDNCQLNQLPSEHLAFIAGDVFQILRKLRDKDRRFDMLVLDPPKFAPTTAQVQRAARGYKDINLLAFKLLRPGGILATFSCSAGVDAALFQKIVASAALDACVDAQILEYLHQGPDHPVALNFPEGAYLKGLILRI